MKIFLDTANLDEIKKYKYAINGVTTNPTLMERAGLKYDKKNIQKICEAVNGPVSIEAVSTNLKDIVDESIKLADYADNIVIKIPMTDYGLAAIEKLRSNKIETNVTLVFSSSQALLAAKSGATYVSPFVGRLDDIGQDGMKLVEDILQIYRNYEFETKVIVASVRHQGHVEKSAKLGAHVATIPTKLLEQMYKHPLTDTGLENFLKDHRKINKK